MLLHQKVNITQVGFMCFRLRTMALGTVGNGFIRLVSNQGETLTLSAWSLTQPYAPFFLQLHNNKTSPLLPVVAAYP